MLPEPGIQILPQIGDVWFWSGLNRKKILDHSMEAIPLRVNGIRVFFKVNAFSIEWFEKIMQEHPDIEILKKSELYQNNREADECYRSYAEVKEK